MSANFSRELSGTDWARVDAMSDDDIDTSDIPPLNEAFFANAQVRLPKRAVTERIHQHVHQLPESFQVEVLDFVEYLLSKVERETARREESGWSDLSLALAMRGMEDEDTPEYSTTDLKEVFS